MLNDLSAGNLVIVLVSLIISMAIHEAMHGYVAHWLGDTTAQEAGRLTLNPLKHIDLFTTILLPMVLILSHVPPIFAAKPVPINPHRLKYDEFGTALVGVAGPLTNLALAIVAAVIFRVGHINPLSGLYEPIILFTAVNIGFFVFNMIPFPPLDGSRLLYAFAPEPLQEIMMRIESIGFMAIIFLFLIIMQFGFGVITSIENSMLNFLLVG